MTTTRERIAIDSLSYQVVQKIKELRLLRGYSQAKLAKETGISTSQIRRYEQRIDAAMRYKESNVPLIIVAGKEYGTGSSRDWAAKGTLLLGIKVVIKESFCSFFRWICI
ncbi:putative transcriptional regulator [Trichonephila clavata]|uniref:Putative transcriptional regulator n=1 Tax=Trichonephila clavata TaxID=2740835 RepID=A0A8X6H9M6_TRICU|nr:putative transcriptional regulator [Trichonephila clavata]